MPFLLGGSLAVWARGGPEMARSVRERIDWERVRKATADSPYAAAFFTLIEGLGLVEEPPATATDARPRIRLGE